MTMNRKDFLKIIVSSAFFMKSSLAAEKTEKFEAIGDGKHDDTKAFEKYLAKNDSLTLSPNKTYLISNLSIKGKTIYGPGKIKIKPSSKGAFILEGNNNKIINIEFVSSGTGIRPESEILLGEQLEYAVISKCSFKGNLFNAIGSNLNNVKDGPYLKNPWRSKLIISECNFSGSYAHHIYMHKIEDLLINNNFFEKSKLDSIRLRQWVRTSTISNNIFKNIGMSNTTDSRDAIDCYWSGLQLNILGNQIDNVASHGLDVKGYSPDQNYGTSKVIIANNQIRNASYSGILVSSGDKTQSGWKAIKNVTISNNHLEGCGHATNNPNDAAIFLRHNQELINIDSNQIYNNFNKGIMVGNFAEDASISKDILIRGNILKSNGRKGQEQRFGIHISGGENVLVSDNILTDHAKGVVSESYRKFKLKNYKENNNIIN